MVSFELDGSQPPSSNRGLADSESSFIINMGEGWRWMVIIRHHNTKHLFLYAQYYASRQTY